MSLSPRVIALLGFGEAGSAIARGLCAEGGWRGTPKPGDNAPRRVIAIDTALDKDARGTALGKEAQRLDVAIEGRYTAALRDADLVICAVQGEHALEAAEAAAPLLKKGAHYLDLCTVTGNMSDEDRAPIEAAGGRYIDIAVMGGFFKSGIKAPMLVAGEDVEPVVAWMNANGFEAKVLGPRPGSASSVKMVRSVLIKGVEALGVEAYVTAERQGILKEVMECLGDVDAMPLPRLHRHAGADPYRACPSPLGGDGAGRPDAARDRRRSADDRDDREAAFAAPSMPASRRPTARCRASTRR